MLIYTLTLSFLFRQILGLRRGKKKPKDSKQESREEASSTSKKDENTRSSEPNMDQEFDIITEKTDGNSLIPSQNLLTEESSVERTLVDDDLSDTDFSSFNEGQA